LGELQGKPLETAASQQCTAQQKKLIKGQFAAYFITKNDYIYI